jgi:glycerol kinase
MSRTSAILALDQGTTSSRAILFGVEGRVLVSAAREFRQIYPRPGWVEHDPEELWASQLEAARAVLASEVGQRHQVVAIGIANQRETTLIWERGSGKPIANALVWQDRRTAAECDRLRASGWEATIRSKTGLVIDPYFSATKLKWLLDQEPERRARAARGELLFGTVDTFLLYHLSGGRLHLTDVSNASRTMLFNIHSLDWDDEILAEFDIPRAMLPEVRPSSGLFGSTDPDIFGTALPVGGVAGDQQAATFGEACFTSGMAKQTYGTGSFLLMNTGSEPARSTSGLLTTIAWQLGSAVTYALEGSIFVTGAAVQWLRDELQLIDDAAESEALARSVDSTRGVYVVPAFAGLGAPYWDPYARGAIVGLTRGSGRAEIVRAVLESVAYQTRDVLDIMQRETGMSLSALRVDGGMVVNDFLMQFQADILGTPVERPAVTETTALGAAYLAGLATGFWRDQEEIAHNWQLERRFEPTMPAARRESLYRDWTRAVARTRGWTEPDVR